MVSKWQQLLKNGKAVFSNKVRVSHLLDQVWNTLSHLKTLSCTFPPSTNELNKTENDQDCHFPSLFHSKSLSSVCMWACMHITPPQPRPLQSYTTSENIPKWWRQRLGFYFEKVIEAKKLLNSFCRRIEKKKISTKNNKIVKAHIFGRNTFINSNYSTWENS